MIKNISQILIIKKIYLIKMYKSLKKMTFLMTKIIYYKK